MFARRLIFRHPCTAQVLAPHTAPLWVSAVRLLPAGVVLVAWAAAQGRPQPRTREAWFAIALFALADGTCFQVRTWSSCPHAWRHMQHAGLAYQSAVLRSRDGTCSEVQGARPSMLAHMRRASVATDALWALADGTCLPNICMGCRRTKVKCVVVALEACL